MDEGTIKTQNPKRSSSLVFNRVYRLEIQSLMLVFSTPLVNCCPFYFLSDLPHPSPLPKVNVQYIQAVCGCGGWGGGFELCCRPYSAGVQHSVSDQIQNLQHATPPQTKTPVMTTWGEDFGRGDREYVDL